MLLVLPIMFCGCGQVGDSAQGADLYNMKSKCPWFDKNKLKMVWTLYLIPDEQRLIYVSFKARMLDEKLRPYSEIYVTIISKNKKAMEMKKTYRYSDLQIIDKDFNIRIGQNYIRKFIRNGVTYYRCYLNFKDENQHVKLDVELKQTVDSWMSGGSTLLSWEKHKNYFEYEIPCPKADLNGTLTIDSDIKQLEGIGYLDNIRWLKSDVPQKPWWYWGLFYSGPYTILWTKLYYPHAKSFLLVSKDANCILDWKEIEPDRISVFSEAEAVTFDYKDRSLSMNCRIDTTSFLPEEFFTFFAPFELHVRDSEAEHYDSGQMVLEIGEWESF